MLRELDTKRLVPSELHTIQLMLVNIITIELILDEAKVLQTYVERN